MYKKLVLSFVASAAIFSSCKKDPVVTPETPLEIPYENLTSTTSYFETFKGDDGNTSVNFSGQTTRIAMLKELEVQVKIWTTANVDADKLKNMFSNTGSPFTSADLNAATDKTLISKVAQSFSATDAETERNRFKAYFDGQAATSLHRTDSAYEGHAGKLGNYLVTEKGYEYAQLIQKGMMGAMMLDQISNIYLGTDEQSADNVAIVAGTNYTALEHHWDEAYGYLTANAYFPMKDPNDNTKWLESYLGSYVRQVSGDLGDPAAVYLAFLKGRAAIVNKDMATRDAQIAIIRAALEKAVATVAVSYLNKTIEATTTPTKFHSLSEGTGFIYSLRFAYNPKINKAKSDELINILMNKAPNGFWSLTTDDLTNVRNQVADAFGISRDAEVNH